MPHYCDVIMGMMASQITSLMIVYWTVYAGADQRKHQSSMSLAFVPVIHQWPVNSLQKWPVMWKMFPFDDVPDSKVHGANMGPHLCPVSPRWAPCRPHETCYLGSSCAADVPAANWTESSAGTMMPENLDMSSLKFHWLTIIPWCFYGQVMPSETATEIMQHLLVQVSILGKYQPPFLQGFHLFSYSGKKSKPGDNESFWTWG